MPVSPRPTPSLSRLAVRLTLACAALSAAAGCQATAPAAPTMLTGQMPVFTASAETPQTQDRGGLKITCAPVSYTMVQKAPADAVAAAQQNPYARRRTVTPVLVPNPDRVALQITINNDMDHLFRSQGAVVQFQIAGKLVAGNAADYAEMANAIVPPRGQQQVTVYGPPLASVPENTTMAVLLYDVVTATDAAGNPTKRENFTWYFTYATQTKQEEAKPITVDPDPTGTAPGTTTTVVRRRRLLF